MPKTESRYRVSLPPLVTYAQAYDNGDPVSPLHPVNYWTNFEAIADRINPIAFGVNRHRPPGPVNHTKVVASRLIPETVYTNGGGHHVTMMNHAHERLSLAWPGASSRNPLWFDGWLSLLSPFELTSTYRNLCVQAFNKQITQVPAKTSAINFAIELLELKPIFKQLGSIPKHIRQDSFSRQVTMKRLNRRSPLNVARKGASAFLSVEFQWLPFVSDIQAFIGTMDAVTKRLDFLRKTKGKETTVRFVKEDCYQRSGLGSEVGLWDDTSDVRQSIWFTHYQCDFVSTWKLFQDLEGLDDAWAQLRGVFAYLGVNNPAKIVWNAIPFSFLVDWVAPVSSWLERVAVQPFFGVWKVYDVTSSVHEKYRFENRFVAKRGGTDGVEFVVDVDSYRRLPYLPITLGDIDFSQLTDTQQKLALALVVSHR